MKHVCWLAIALVLTPIARSQEIEKIRQSTAIRVALISKPLGVAREVKATALDFATFRDSEWSALTLAQIGAAAADAVTSLNNLHSCPGCYENGLSTFFVGRRLDAH
jgi:hypothetical protein